MNNFRNYFLEAGESANEQFLNADGYNYADGYDYNYAEGDAAAPSFAANTAPTAQPFIVQLANTTAAAITNVSMFGAFQSLGASNFGFNAGISVSMGVAGVTYQQLLYQTMTKPFAIGMTYVQAGGWGTNSGSPATQILEALSLTFRDANGNTTTNPLIPTIDPYQQQQYVLALKFAYIIDAQTTLTINSVLAFTTVKFYFYPSEDVNLARGLVGRSVNRGFTQPSVVKQDRVVLAPSTVQNALGM